MEKYLNVNGKKYQIADIHTISSIANYSLDSDNKYIDESIKRIFRYNELLFTTTIKKIASYLNKSKKNHKIDAKTPKKKKVPTATLR